VAIESSVTDNNAYYWENRLLAGGGVRFAPPLGQTASKVRLNRMVVYGEYLRVASYYRSGAPTSIPKDEVRIGVNFSLGQWYR